MFVNIHGNRSMLGHSWTFYNIGEQCSTMLNGRPHGSILVGQHISTKIHQCSPKVASSKRGVNLTVRPLYFVRFPFENRTQYFGTFWVVWPHVIRSSRRKTNFECETNVCLTRDPNINAFPICQCLFFKMRRASKNWKWKLDSWNRSGIEDPHSISEGDYSCD